MGNFNAFNFLNTDLKTEGKRVTEKSSEENPLGWVAKKYESGKSGVETISTGKGDKGGVSYGSHQMKSEGGWEKSTIGDFIKKSGYQQNFADENWFMPYLNPEQKSTSPYYQPGSEEFNKKYKELATKDPVKFGQEQHKYITDTHYTPLANKLRVSLGMDPSKFGPALKEAIYSVGVQFGGYTNLINKALEGLDPRYMTEEDIIRKIYEERNRTNESDDLVYFRSSSKEVQENIKKRYSSEINDVLSLIR